MSTSTSTRSGSRLPTLFCKGLQLAAVSLLLGTGATFAQDYPAKQITMIVPFTPGGGADNVARRLVDGLEKIIGAKVIIENRPGSNGTIGINAVARAEPDGYTIGFVAGSGMTIAPAFTKNLPFDPRTDFAAVADITSYALGLVIRKDLPVTNMSELMDLAQQAPESVSYASTGYGSIAHLGGSILELETGAKLKHVPYKGASESALEVIAGRIDFTITGLLPIAAQIEEGNVELLAVTGLDRIPEFPDVAAIAETYPGFLLDARFMLLAPAGTPEEIINKLNEATVQVLNDPAFRTPLEDEGYFVPTETTPESTSASIISELDRWTSLAEELDITLDSN